MITKICKECAIAKGGKWLNDYHVATVNRDKCDVCKSMANVCHPRNWKLQRGKSGLEKAIDEFIDRNIK